jgi:predicted RNA binding protein YcfA (HicA-like mRNA interferase family)
MKLQVIKPKQLIRVLRKLGCVEKRQTGSHRIFYCSMQKRIISVPFHNKDIKKGLLGAIIKDLDLSLEEFNRLLKD